ncbi:hypothetical protein G6F43_005209 [Rhizopus delemar]|nr:hypothetical protein G6F43_005209 [Rhizopus delemar]
MSSNRFPSLFVVFSFLDNSFMPQDNKQLQRLRAKLAADSIAKQFSLPTTGFKFIHLPIQCRLPLNQLRSSLHRLHINTRRILNIQYPDRHVVSFLIHYGYENELREQLRKVHILVRDNFDPLDPENVRDPEFINAPTHRKAEHTRWAFLQRLGPALCRFKTV